VPIAAYSIDIYTAMNQIEAFLVDPLHSHEVVFWRIKPDTGSDTDELAGVLRSQLAPYMLDNPTGNASLLQFTLNEIWKNNKNATLVMFSMGWTAPAVEPGKNQGWFWDYSTNQDGDYSDEYTMEAMLTRCVDGQFPQLISWKADNDSGGILFGTWWTFTTQNIQSNTASQWSSYPNALNDFFVVNSGEIGTSLLSDFFGDYTQVMEVVWDYNLNKYCSFPPRSPYYGRTVLGGPSLPGTSILNNSLACENVGSATTAWTDEIIGVTVAVVVVVFILVCVLPCVVVYCYRKKQSKKDVNCYHAPNHLPPNEENLLDVQK